MWMIKKKKEDLGGFSVQQGLKHKYANMDCNTCEHMQVLNSFDHAV